MEIIIGIFGHIGIIGMIAQQLNYNIIINYGFDSINTQSLMLLGVGCNKSATPALPIVKPETRDQRASSLIPPPQVNAPPLLALLFYCMSNQNCCYDNKKNSY